MYRGVAVTASRNRSGRPPGTPVAPKGAVQHVEEPGHMWCDLLGGWRYPCPPLSRNARGAERHGRDKILFVYGNPTLNRQTRRATFGAKAVARNITLAQSPGPL